MAPAQSKTTSAESESKSRQKALAASSKRENAKKKAAKERGIDLSTPLLDDGSCNITLGSLMESENLDFDQAVEVMKRFRSEATEQRPAEADEGWELPKLSKTKKPAGKSASAEAVCVAASDSKTPVDPKPASKKRKNVGQEDEGTEHKGKTTPKPKAKGKAKAKASPKPPVDDPEEPVEESPKPAPKKKSKANTPAKEPSSASKAKPASSIPESEPEMDAAEDEPPTDPTPESKTKKVKKGKKSKKGKAGKGKAKLCRLKATAALGEEGEEEGAEVEDEELHEEQAEAPRDVDKEIEDMIREIDEQIEEKSEDGKDKSCLSLELGEKQMGLENPGPDYEDTLVNGSSVTELGASASQVSNNNVENILAVVEQLRKQLLSSQQREASDAKAREDAAALEALEDKAEHPDPNELDGEPCEEDDEHEAQAEAEMVESVQSDVSSRREAEAVAKVEEARRPVATPVRSSEPTVADPASALLGKLHSTRSLGVPGTAALAGTASVPGTSTAGPTAETPTPGAATGAGEPTVVNSATHKREYMRLVPRLQQGWTRWFALACLELSFVHDRKHQSLAKKRLVDNGTITATAYPSMHQLANGTMKERAELLKRWVSSAENLQSCEHQIIASRKANIRGKRDCDCPGVVEETKYWVTVEESKTVPLNEEVFRTDEEKHDKWSSEIKRELATLSSLLIDVPQDDDLKTDLDRCSKRLKGLALKFKTAKTGAEMEPICNAVWTV
ncbi:unnamed protein product, partial [Symbiodinium microadriaticum]